MRHLATRPGHDEVKADFRQLLIEEFEAELGQLNFERQVPEVKGRIDALIGRTVFEAKKNLDREWPDVVRRMPDYLSAREAEEGERFVGIASDGLKWTAFELSGGTLAKITETTLDPDKPESFLAWLDGVVALKASLPPEPLTIRIELGQESVTYRRAAEKMTELWGRLKSEPAVALKRDLWSSLLKLVYGREIESDALWIQHTFLVVVAKAIAQAVLGVREDDPARMLSGKAFESAGLLGAVESDFFDWIVADDEGVELVRTITARVRRFRLKEVQSDVLKILYESLIDRDERHGLGEYYTPDWLAAKMVRHAVDRPVEQRVLDPACGSGTFLFHAIRHFLTEAEEAGVEEERRAAEATNQVAGLDIHPVAVIIARVTYLLALAPVLAKRSGAISIPVYLGDSMQLSISHMMAGKELTIRVPPPPAGEGASGEPTKNGGEQLDFPETFCRDPGLFDKAIGRMREASAQGLTRYQVEAALRQLTEQHYRLAVTKEQHLAITDLGKTYVTFDRLRREGRDTVWAYVARNLSRPLHYAANGGWANVLVGNPPWVALRHMSADLQKRFKELAKGERVYVGGKFATQNDLAGLFTVRAAGLYLRAGGKLAFVLPMAALSRGQFDKLREGSFHTARLAWEKPWVMNDDVSPLFPVPSCAVFAVRRAVGRKMPKRARIYSGTLPLRDASEEIADARLTVVEDADAPAEGTFTGGSPYRSAFRQGATLVPRMLCFVERSSAGGVLGGNPAAPHVKSRRSTQEKKPWRDLPGIEANVEREFVRPTLLGESILPFRVFRPFEAVIPVSADGEVLDAKAAANRGHSGLHDWMHAAERVWDADKPSDMSFIEQLDYYGKLRVQFPVPALRVAYAASGTNPAACILTDGKSAIEHKLYWSGVSTLEDAHYLLAILNSETARSRTASLQSRGQWGARDFDKVVFTLPIPRFNPSSKLHTDLASAAAEAEAIAAAVELPESVKFQRARKLVRDALTEAGISERIDALVARLLDGE